MAAICGSKQCLSGRSETEPRRRNQKYVPKKKKKKRLRSPELVSELEGWRSSLPFDPVALEMNLKGCWRNQSAVSTEQEVAEASSPLSSERLFQKKTHNKKY